MKFIILLTSIAFFVSGCVNSPSGSFPGSSNRVATISDKMSKRVGQSEITLVSELGPPDYNYTASNGSKIISYEVDWGIGAKSPLCVMKYLIENGVVTKWGNKGCPKRFTTKNQELIPNSIPVPKPTLN